MKIDHVSTGIYPVLFAGCTLLGAIHSIFHGFPVFVHDGKVDASGPFAPAFRFPVVELRAFDKDSVFSGLQLYSAVKRCAVAINDLPSICNRNFVTVCPVARVSYSWDSQVQPIGTTTDSLSPASPEMRIRHPRRASSVSGRYSRSYRKEASCKVTG